MPRTERRDRIWVVGACMGSTVMTAFSISGPVSPIPPRGSYSRRSWIATVIALTVINHIGFMRRSRRGRALKLDISLEAFLLARRYTTKDGKEWVHMMVPIDRLLDVLEGKAEYAGINQICDERDDRGAGDGALA